MTKVLYIGHQGGDGGGYSQAATDYILAMDHVGIDVTPRPFRLNDEKFQVHPRIKELEKKDCRGATHIIQHTLPVHMKYHGGAKNIGLFASETSDFAGSSWGTRLNTMDEVWVPSVQMIDACRLSRVKHEPKVVPHCVQTEVFQQSWEPLDIPVKDTFKFYFIGEFNRRKNLAALLKAFHLEFRPNEPVSLIIKTNKPGLSDQECTSQVLDFCKMIRNGLKLSRAKSEVIITQKLTHGQIMSLHSMCDCLVSPSYGEACSIPSLYALGFGNTPIAASIPMQYNHLTFENSYIAECYETPVFGMDGTFPDLYLGGETWWEISVPDLRRCMRMAFEDKEDRRKKSLQGMKDVFKYNYTTVGNEIKEILNERS